MNNKSFIIFVLCFFFWQFVDAQSGEEVFSFLRYPLSTRVNALGGNHVSIVEADPSLTFHNPSLLGGEMDNMLNISYLNYISDINVGSALFSKAWKERGAWAVGATYFSQGRIYGMSETGTPLGDFTVKDISIEGAISYDLTEHWRGGFAFKFLYSGLCDYTSLGLAVDAGVSYYHSEKQFAFGFVLKQIGAQLKAYENDRQKMPWDIQMGFSKKMRHAPIRFSLTAQYLTKWKLPYVDDDSQSGDDPFFKTFLKHLIIGMEIIPSDNFWLGIGYNPKRSLDMKLEGGNALAGFSGGCGIKIKMFDIGFSVAKYHPSALSFMLGMTLRLDDLK